MKKTLIALAVTMSVVASGSSTAAGWVSGGTGGTVNIAGTLVPAEKTPWQVWLNSSVQNLNSPITKDETSVDITLNASIPVLGIRTLTQDVFNGGPGLSPQINFGQVLGNFSNGIATLTLDVKDKTANTKIGTLTAPFSAAAVGSWYNAANSNKGNRSLYAVKVGDAFFGGVGAASDQVALGQSAVKLIASLSSDFSANFNDQGAKVASYSQVELFSSSNVTYSAYYGSGIQAGSTVKINLDSPAGSSNIEWTAALPVVVSYQ